VSSALQILMSGPYARAMLTNFLFFFALNGFLLLPLYVKRLGGSETMGDRRAATEKEIVGTFKAMEEELPSSLSSSENFQSIKTNWERLRKEGLNLTTDDNFAAHTRLIGQLLLFEAAAADAYCSGVLPVFFLFLVIKFVAAFLFNLSVIFIHVFLVK